MNNYGYQPKPCKNIPSPPNTDSCICSKKNQTERDLLILAEECKKRGNRLEIMNGKIYEVSRKLIGEIE